MGKFGFEIVTSDKKARVGKLVSPHGVVDTPLFLPVATQASVKALSSEDVKETGCGMVLANTYHLYLRPGADTVQKMGGLHKFMNWDGPILTDSGGFQVFSLGFGIEHGMGKMTSLYAGELIGNYGNSSELVVRTKLCKIEEEGPTFQSHLDGSVHFFPPEKSVETQIKLGADFIVALDECTSPLHNHDYTKTSMGRSRRWEKRSLDFLKKIRNSKFEIRNSAEMFGVVQGGPYEDLRVESAKFVSDSGFFGVGIGGALVSREKMVDILNWIHPHLDPQKPRHLLGIGTIKDIFLAVEQGVDIFDCVHPTRLARSGMLLPNIDINKAIYREDKTKIWGNYTRAYLHHLFRSRELLGYRLATIHNLQFMMRLMEEVREAIAAKKFAKLKEKWLNS